MSDEDAAASSGSTTPPPPTTTPNVLSYRQPTLGERVVTLATFTDSFEANLVMTKLQAEGVPCTLAGVELGGGIAGYGPAFGKIDVNVVEADLPREILETIAATQAARREANVTRNVPCPICGSTDTKRRLARGWVAMIVIAVGVVAILVTSDTIWLLPTLLIASFLVWTTDKTRTKCNACGHTWVHRVDDDDHDEDDEDEADEAGDAPRSSTGIADV